MLGAPLGPQQHHFTEKHTIAAKFSRCIAVSAMPLPAEAGLYLIKCLKPGGSPAARVAHHELSVKWDRRRGPFPPQHLALAHTSCSTTGVLQEIPSHTFLIFYNRAAISATHPERIFNEKRGEREHAHFQHIREQRHYGYTFLFFWLPVAVPEFSLGHLLCGLLETGSAEPCSPIAHPKEES